LKPLANFKATFATKVANYFSTGMLTLLVSATQGIQINNYPLHFLTKEHDCHATAAEN
jgi:hypothetical protein